MLEVGAFRAAVHRRSDESVLQMEQNLQKQQDLTNLFNMTEYVQLNREFHWIITMEAQNATMRSISTNCRTRSLPTCCSGTAPPPTVCRWISTFASSTAFRDGRAEGVLALMEDLQLAEECVRESQQL